MHQMVPDIVIGNLKFLDGLSEEEREIFNEGFAVLSKVERESWNAAVEDAKAKATEMGVQFTYPDIEPFKEKVLPLHEEVLTSNPKLRPIYEAIQEVEYESADSSKGE